MAHQYRDLPQIPQAIDESDLTVWGFEHNSFLQPYKYHAECFSLEADVSFENIDTFASSMASMQPMQRFMLDQSPLSALLNVNIPIAVKDERQYEHPWPSVNCLRNVSPDRTSLSEVSSHATQNEFCSPVSYHRAPYESPVEFSQPLMLYPTVEHFTGGGYLSEAQGQNISLRELEYEHPEPDTAIEDTICIDTKQVVACGHEFDLVKSSSTPQLKYADSGIGNSVRDAESVQPIDDCEEPTSDSDYHPSRSRLAKRQRVSTSKGSTRRRRRQSRKDSHAPEASDSARPRKKGRGSLTASRQSTQIDSKADDRRCFPCPLAPYGCLSIFSSKNEWKRHISTQHVKLSYWRCDLCPPTTDPNDAQALYYNEFNRKDLFTQHLRRMHGPPKDAPPRAKKDYPVNEENLAEHQARCLRTLREAPQQSVCLFCEQQFQGRASWEERIEHVGRHMEKDRTNKIDMLDITSWNVDQQLEQYLLEEGLIEKKRGGWIIGNGKPKRDTEAQSDEESEED